MALTAYGDSRLDIHYGLDSILGSVGEVGVFAIDHRGGEMGIYHGVLPEG